MIVLANFRYALQRVIDKWTAGGSELRQATAHAKQIISSLGEVDALEVIAATERAMSYGLGDSEIVAIKRACKSVQDACKLRKNLPKVSLRILSSSHIVCF